MKYEIFKTDTPELIATSIDSDFVVTFATRGGLEFEIEPLELVNQINENMLVDFVGARPVRKPK